MSSSTSLKILASVAIITIIGGYGLSKLYNNNKKFRPPDDYDYYDYDYDYYDYEISDEDDDDDDDDDDTEKVIILNSTKKSLNSPYTSTGTSSITTKISQYNNNNNNKPSIPKRHCMVIENLIVDIITKQNQAIYFRKKYHKNLNEILKQIDDMREKVCVTEAEHLKNIHKLLDEIENHHKHENDFSSDVGSQKSQKSVESLKSQKSVESQKSQKSVESLKSQKSVESLKSQKSRKSVESQKSQKSVESLKSQKSQKSHESHESHESQKSHVKELEKQVTQEEAYLDTELKVFQADLGMLMWKYEELENYASKEWKDSQLEIQQLRAKLMNDATRFSKVKVNKC